MFWASCLKRYWIESLVPARCFVILSLVLAKEFPRVTDNVGIAISKFPQGKDRSKWLSPFLYFVLEHFNVTSEEL